MAYPYETLEKIQVVNDTVGGQPIAIFWASGTASALDTGSIASGRDVGFSAAYSRVLDGLDLRFDFVDGRIIDQQTGSEWNVLGQAIAGELMGNSLRQSLPSTTSGFPGLHSSQIRGYISHDH